MKTVRKIAVWLLMLALPLQGLAAFAPAADCGDGRPAAHHAHETQQNHHGASAVHEHAATQQHHDDNPPSDQSGGHSCCHHVFAGVPSANVPGTPAPPHAVMQRVSLLYTLHIPELPQRPPRA